MYSRASDAIERDRVGSDPSSFRLTLATDGEATDGHILSIEGAELPEQMPLLLSHENDPRSQVGHLEGFSRHLRESPKRLRARGVIEMGGEGVAADERRDLALKIERGHVRGVSVRWDPIDAIPRAELPPDHPARVDEDERDPRKRFGLYFSKWRALEGSIVSVGADAQAQIGRTFADYSPAEGAMRLLSRAAEHCRVTGLSAEDILNAVWAAAKLSTDPGELVEFAFDGRTIMLPRALHERLACPPAPVAEKPAPIVRVPFSDTIALVVAITERNEQARLERLAAEYHRLRGRI